MAAEESTIMNFAQRLAGTGAVVGVSQKDIMALSAAMASVGINAVSGGSAMSKVLTKMNNAVKDGGEKLQGFAKVSGMSMKFKDYVISIAVSVVTCAVVTTLLRLAVASL